MSNSSLEDYSRLKKMSDGERWVWLAGRLEEINGQQQASETVQGIHETCIKNINDRCVGRTWLYKLAWLSVGALVLELSKSLWDTFKRGG